MAQDTPETFEERRDAMLRTITELAKWPHHNQDGSGVHSFDDVIERAYRLDRIPESAVRENSIDGSLRCTTYTWQIMCSSMRELAPLSEEEIREWTEEQRDKSNPVTATDGSKGQWRAANQARINLGAWLVSDE